MAGNDLCMVFHNDYPLRGAQNEKGLATYANPLNTSSPNYLSLSSFPVLVIRNDEESGQDQYTDKEK